MKKLLLFGLILVGCGDDRAIDEKGNADDWTWSIVEFDGHEYVKAHASGHGNVLHSPNCPCKSKDVD